MPGTSDHLLRRRDRHGRQFISVIATVAGPNAVEPGPQRRLFQGKSAAAYLPIRSTRNITTKPLTWKISRRISPSLLWWTRRVIAMRKNSRRFRAARLNFFIQTIQGSCVPSPARGRNHSGDSESLALCAIGGTGSFTLLRLCADGSFSRNLFRPIRNPVTSSRWVHMRTTGSPCTRRQTDAVRKKESCAHNKCADGARDAADK